MRLGLAGLRVLERKRQQALHAILAHQLIAAHFAPSILTFLNRAGATP